MKNNKGFTLIELIASFTLALIIMFYLFQIVIVVKELYVSSGLKTEMMIKKSNIEKQIGLDFNTLEITKIVACGTDCYTFTYSDSSTKILKVDRANKTIIYGDYQMTMMDGSSIGEYKITQNTVSGVGTGKNNTILIIEIPVTNKVIADRNFGIRMVYQYDNRTKNLGL